MSVFGDPAQFQNFHSMISSLFASGKYSDLTIKCQGKEWKVHRTVVCSQSKPLAAAVDGHFKEAKTGEVALDEDDPEVVERMLFYLYHGHYQDGSGFTSDQSSSLFGGLGGIKFAAQPANTAPPGAFSFSPSVPPSTDSAMSTSSSSIFGGTTPSSSRLTSSTLPPTSSTMPVFGRLPPLSGHALQPATSINATGGGLFGGPPPPATSATAPVKPPSTSKPAIRSEALVTNAKVYIMAEQYDIQPLKHYAKGKYQEILPATWNSSSFVESLRLIYDGTPDASKMDALREVALKAAADHAQDLMDRGEFLTLCRERGEISTDILKVALTTKDGHRRPVAEPNLNKKCPVDATHAVAKMTSIFGNGGNRYKCTVCNTYID